MSAHRTDTMQSAQWQDTLIITMHVFQNVLAPVIFGGDHRAKKESYWSKTKLKDYECRRIWTAKMLLELSVKDILKTCSHIDLLFLHIMTCYAINKWKFEKLKHDFADSSVCNFCKTLYKTILYHEFSLFI